jgi:hypothetical protein
MFKYNVIYLQLTDFPSKAGGGGPDSYRDLLYTYNGFLTLYIFYQN